MVNSKKKAMTTAKPYQWQDGMGDAKAETLYYETSTIAAHKPPSIDPGSDWWQDGMGDAKAETLCYKTSTIAAHRPPSIDPGSDQWQDDMGDAKAETLCYKASNATCTGHWVGQRGNNRRRMSCIP